MTISRNSSLASFFSTARFCIHSSPIDALKYVLICLYKSWKWPFTVSRTDYNSHWCIFGQVSTWKAKGCIFFTWVLQPAVSTKPFWIEKTILLSHPFQWKVTGLGWTGFSSGLEVISEGGLENGYFCGIFSTWTVNKIIEIN